MHLRFFVEKTPQDAVTLLRDAVKQDRRDGVRVSNQQADVVLQDPVVVLPLPKPEGREQGAARLHAEFKRLVVLLW